MTQETPFRETNCMLCKHMKVEIAEDSADSPDHAHYTALVCDACGENPLDNIENLIPRTQKFGAIYRRTTYFNRTEGAGRKKGDFTRRIYPLAKDVVTKPVCPHYRQALLRSFAMRIGYFLRHAEIL